MADTSSQNQDSGDVNAVTGHILLNATGIAANASLRRTVSGHKATD